MGYIDEDVIYNNIEEKYKVAKGKAREAYSDVLDTICEMPRADVVLRSEYDAVVEENESLGIELENMRRNLGDAREGWNYAECEVEKLREINSLLTEAGQEWQRRYNDVKTEVAREIFAEIELKLSANMSSEFKDNGDSALWFDYYDSHLAEDIAELKKKYT